MFKCLAQVDTGGPMEHGADRRTQVSEPRPVLFPVNLGWYKDVGTGRESTTST